MPHDTVLEERAAAAARTAAATAATSPDGTFAPDAAPAPAASAHDDLRSLEAGLDRLQTSPDRAQSAWRRFTTSVLPPILFVLALLVAWQLYVVIAQPRPDIVPGPVDVFNAMVLAWESGRLQLAVITSLERGVVGFLIAVIVGTLANSAITLARGERGGDCPVAIVEDGYGPGQRVTVGTLDTIALQAARRGIRSPAVVVVGDVVTLSPYASPLIELVEINGPDLVSTSSFSGTSSSTNGHRKATTR